MTPGQRFLAARWGYVAVVLLATLSNLHLSLDGTAASERLVRAFTPSLGWRDAIDGLRNTVLFAGLGAVWVVTSRSGNVRAEIRRATLVGLALSVTVEGLQVFSPVRTASIVDVTTNMLGALLGAGAVALLIAAVVAAKGARSYLGVPTFLMAGAYAGAVLCEALTPLFGPAALPWTAGGPVGRLQAGLHAAGPVAFDTLPLVDLLLFAPAGFLCVMLERERGRDARWVGVAGGGAGLALVAELGHGMLGFPIWWGAALVRAAGVALGAWAAHRALPALTQLLRGAARARAALFAYGALLVLWGWRLFVPRTDLPAITAQLAPENLVPLASLAQRVDAFSALHVLQQFLLYVPLGSLLAVWPLRLRGRWGHLWPGVWLAGVIELGHIVIVERTFDTTNALVACAGLGIGWIVVRRSGFAPYGEALDAGRPARATP
jgi:glycopeptide antibiotics resistance protein